MAYKISDFDHHDPDCEYTIESECYDYFDELVEAAMQKNVKWSRKNAYCIATLNRCLMS